MVSVMKKDKWEKGVCCAGEGGLGRPPEEVDSWRNLKEGREEVRQRGQQVA